MLALPTEGNPDELGNVIILASNRKLKLRNDLRSNYADFKFKLSMNHQKDFAWNNKFVPDTSNTLILTDDLNPLDLWSEQINLVARKDLHNFFKKSGLSW